MTDFAIQINDENEFDISFSDTDIELDTGLRAPVIYSLYSDARCEDDELPLNQDSKRGFWGDLIGEKVKTGSKLWLLDRSVLSPAIRELNQEYAQDSLAWMVSEGLAKSLSAESTLISRNEMDTQIKISRPDGSQSIYSPMWTSEGGNYGL